MKFKTFATWTLALLVVAGGVYLLKPEVYTEYAPEWWAQWRGKEKLPGSAWADPEGLRDNLSGKILKAIGNDLSESNIKAFLLKPENRLMLAQWTVAQGELDSAELLKKDEEIRAKDISRLKETVARAESARPAGGGLLSAKAEHALKQQKEQLAEMEEEAMLPHSLLETVNTPGGSRLMEALGNDEAWMEQVAFSGESIRPGMAAAILSRMLDRKPTLAKASMERDIATATALEFAKANADEPKKSNWYQNRALERADFYTKAWKAGRLNPLFGTLPFWQRRMVCGCKGDNDFGSVESLEWALDNVNLPADQYGSCCWRCGYKLYNLYAQIIHNGEAYYGPFRDNYGRNSMHITYDVGGVCGGLSHFGAFAALAHGVPATTAGEPGHCSFVVRVGDEWRPAYSLTWNRRLHWRVWPGMSEYSSLHAACELYSPQQKDATERSRAYRVLGGIYATQKDLKRAGECYRKAAKAQPRDVVVWRDWAKMLNALAAEPDAAHAKAWDKLHETLCETLVKDYPGLAAAVLTQSVYPGLAAAMGEDAAALRAAILSFWKHLDGMGPDRWRVEELAHEQAKTLGIDTQGKDTDTLCALYGDILGAVASSTAYSPIILSWGNTLSSKLPEADQQKFLAAMLNGLGKGTGLTPEDRDKMLAPAILAAEQARDLTTFQAIGRMLSPAYKQSRDKLPEIKQSFPGKLASQGGLVWTSSTSKYEDPCGHWGLLEPGGGHFHTAKDTDAFVAVQLPRQVHVTGIILVATPGNRQRLGNMKVQVSETGKDGDWTDVAQLGPCKERVNAIDLGASLPLAKYVRIVRPGGPEFFHLNAIYVYGNPAA